MSLPNQGQTSAPPSQFATLPLSRNVTHAPATAAFHSEKPGNQEGWKRLGPNLFAANEAFHFSAKRGKSQVSRAKLQDATAPLLQTVWSETKCRAAPATGNAANPEAENGKDPYHIGT